MAKRAIRASSVRGRGKTRRTRRSPRRNNAWWILAALVALGVFLVSRHRPDDESSDGIAFTGGDLHSMVVDPTNPSRIWVGGHEAVSVSIDGGKTWRQVDSLANRDAMGWGIDLPTLYVSGHPGLTVSTDGGRTFTERNQGLPSTDVHAFGAGKGVLYGAAPPVGMFTSTDGGESWRVVGGQGRSFFGRILVDPEDPRHLIAGDAASGVAQSRDGGATFQNLGGLRSPTWLSWDPANTKLLIASGPAGAARTEDGGENWHKVSVPEGASILEIDPTDSQTIYAASHEGNTVEVMVSRDGGTTWQTP